MSRIKITESPVVWENFVLNLYNDSDLDYDNFRDELEEAVSFFKDFYNGDKLRKDNDLVEPLFNHFLNNRDIYAWQDIGTCMSLGLDHVLKMKS